MESISVSGAVCTQPQQNNKTTKQTNQQNDKRHTRPRHTTHDATTNDTRPHDHNTLQHAQQHTTTQQQNNNNTPTTHMYRYRRVSWCILFCGCKCNTCSRDRQSGGMTMVFRWVCLFQCFKQTAAFCFCLCPCICLVLCCSLPRLKQTRHVPSRGRCTRHNRVPINRDQAVASQVRGFMLPTTTSRGAFKFLREFVNFRPDAEDARVRMVRDNIAMRFCHDLSKFGIATCFLETSQDLVRFPPRALPLIYRC